MTHQKTEKDINWTNVSIIVGYHLALFVGMPLYLYSHSIHWSVWAFCAVVIATTGFGVTMGYHRYFSHRTYKAHPAVEFALLVLGTIATQGSVLRWSHDHRIHHAYCDSERDPYSIKKGFWHAHMGWLFERPIDFNPKVVSDLVANPWIMFQQRHYLSLMLASNFSVILLAGWLCSDFVGAFLVVGLFRMFYVHHCTWFINSLAHKWGQHSFSKEISAVDNYIVSILTFGEGYHNYHHAFANDFRNGIRWYHFDPSKWIIWGLSRIGLTHNLRKVSQYHIQKTIMGESRDESLEKVRKSGSPNGKELEEKVLSSHDGILAKLAAVHQSIEAYNKSRKDGESREQLSLLKGQIKQQRRELKVDCRQWDRLNREIGRLGAAA